MQLQRGDDSEWFNVRDKRLGGSLTSQNIRLSMYYTWLVYSGCQGRAARDRKKWYNLSHQN